MFKTIAASPTVQKILLNVTAYIIKETARELLNIVAAKIDKNMKQGSRQFKEKPKGTEIDNSDWEIIK